MTLRVVIVDDEAVARSRLRRLLAAHDDVTIAAEAADGRSAVDAIVRHRPDVVFLDIRMPELDGFEVVAELTPGEVPSIVFVTAFSDHAAKAFDANALDYLLKPYDPERLAESLNRARDRRRSGNDDGRRILAALEEVAREQRALRLAVSSPAGGAGLAAAAPNARRYPERILVTRRGHGVFVPLQDIDYVESAGNYVRLHVGTEEHRLRIRLSDMEAQLDPSRFARIHRTVIVNVGAVAEIQPWFSGDAIVILKDGAKLRLSRHYRGAIESTFGLSADGLALDAPGLCTVGRRRRATPALGATRRRMPNASRSAAAASRRSRLRLRPGSSSRRGGAAPTAPRRARRRCPARAVHPSPHALSRLTRGTVTREGRRRSSRTS
jgi:two-component system LytT family response regulator